MKSGALSFFITLCVMVGCHQSMFVVDRIFSGKQSVKAEPKKDLQAAASPTPSAREPSRSTPPRASPTPTPYKKMTFTVDPEPEADGLSDYEMEQLRQLLEDKGYGDRPRSDRRLRRQDYERLTREHQTY